MRFQVDFTTEAHSRSRSVGEAPVVSQPEGIRFKKARTDFLETMEKLIRRAQQTQHGCKDIQNAADDVVASNIIEAWVG